LPNCIIIDESHSNLLIRWYNLNARYQNSLPQISNITMSVPIYPLSNSCAAYIKCSPFRLLLSIYIHLSSLLLLLSCPTSILILRCLDPNIYLKSFIKSYTNVMSISLTPCTTFNSSISHHLFYTQSLLIDNHLAILNTSFRWSTCLSHTFH
jgi:hypothetical protein